MSLFFISGNLIQDFVLSILNKTANASAANFITSEAICSFVVEKNQQIYLVVLIVKLVAKTLLLSGTLGPVAGEIIFCR